MRQLSLLFLLLFTITNSFCQGKKVILEEVEVKEKAIPEITISGTRYSYKERDFFIKTLLTQPFWEKDFKMKKQAIKINTWAKNVYVKVPVANSKGKFMGKIIKELNSQNIKLNITAVYTSKQTEKILKLINKNTKE